MKHPLKHLLIAAAEDENAMFRCEKFDPHTYSIRMILEKPNEDWNLVEKPELWAKEKAAFAKGNAIEYRDRYFSTQWEPSTSPMWFENCEYRIKPQTETRWQWRSVDGESCTGKWHATAPKDYYCIKLEYTAQEFEVEVTE